MKRPKKVDCSFCRTAVSKRFLQEHFLTCASAPNLQEGEHICSLCQAVKNLEADFPMSISNPGGKAHECKECTKLRHNHWRRLKNDKTPSVVIENRPLRKDGKPSRVWQKRPCPICGTRYNFRAMHAHVLVCDGTPNQPQRPQSPFEPDMEKILNDQLVKDKKLEQRARHLWRAYGLSIPAYDRMVAEQNGKCAICKCDPTPLRRTSKEPVFEVDHCHATNMVRGLLCGPCNRGIGQFSDNEDAIIAAGNYILRHRALYAATHKS